MQRAKVTLTMTVPDEPETLDPFWSCMIAGTMVLFGLCGVALFLLTR